MTIILDRTFKVLFSTLMLITLSFFISTSGFANSSETIELSEKEGKTVQLSIGKTVHIMNSNEESTIEVKHQNDLLYTRSIAYGYVEAVTVWHTNGREYIVFNSRTLGSGSTLSFTLLETDADSVTEIYHSNEYAKGKIEIINETITVSYPTYSEGDSLAAPSKIVSEVYLLTENALALSDKQEKVIKKGEQSFSAQSGSPTNQNPPWDKISQYLTEAAVKHGIPPEVLKAIAYQESAWQQFRTTDYTDKEGNVIWKKGDPVIGFDGRGLGIMQITLSKSYLEANPEVEERLKYDIQYNIDWGVKILLEKWAWSSSKYSPIPTVNDGSKAIIENWYFAIMAYNGLSKVNDPNLSSEERQKKYPWTREAYQETIYKHMNRYGLINPEIISPGKLDIGYRQDRLDQYNEPYIMTFASGQKLNYTTSLKTKSNHLFQQGEMLVTTTDVNFRDSVNGNLVRKLLKGEKVTVLSTLEYSPTRDNHFVWYKVKAQDGTVGYIASSYIEQSNNSANASFLDFKEGARGYNAVSILALNGIIQGDANGKFNPDDTLTRIQAALMLSRALDLNLVGNPDPEFKDISKNYRYYDVIASVKQAGIFQGDTKGNFNLNQKLTRGQMAAALVRAYKLTGNTSTPFKDIKGSTLQEEIEILYANNITSGLTEIEYGIDKEIKRRDFSILLYNTMVKP